MGYMMGGYQDGDPTYRDPMMGRNYYGGNGMAYTMMGGYGGGWFSMGLLGLLYVAVGAFIFGIIFWWTKKLILGEKKKK